MCIIVYKPKGASLPSKKTLKQCFNNNADGAGFMLAKNGEVLINKGFFKFDDFYKKLTAIKEDVPMVLHFRITTQGGVRADCCHPYPLSDNMHELRRLNTTAEVGVAHNGIISLTSTYNKVDYNDTMRFITDYLTLIIDKKSRFNYYKDDNKITLINRLIGSSRLAILDKNEHCELIGDGWLQDSGCYYSNGSYKSTTTKKTKKITSYSSYSWDYFDEWEAYLNTKTGLYEFSGVCPYTIDGDANYCDECVNNAKCWWLDSKEEGGDV